MRALLLQASREARRRAVGELSKGSGPAAAGIQARSFAAAPVKADAATPKQREVSKKNSQGGGTTKTTSSRSASNSDAVERLAQPCAFVFDAPVPRAC